MSAFIKQDLLLWKQNRTLKDYSIFFLADFYNRCNPEEFTNQDKSDVLIGLNIENPNYTPKEMFDTMFTMEYDHEMYLAGVDLKTMAFTYYKVLGVITLEEYNDILTKIKQI